MAFLGDWRSKEEIHAERAKNEAAQQQYAAYKAMVDYMNPQLLKEMNNTSAGYLTAKANNAGAMTQAGNVGGTQYARQMNRQGINANSTGYQANLQNYYSKLASENANIYRQIQDTEEQRKKKAQEDYYRLNAGGANALQNVTYGNNIWDKFNSIASIAGMIYNPVASASSQGGSILSGNSGSSSPTTNILAGSNSASVPSSNYNQTFAPYTLYKSTPTVSNVSGNSYTPPKPTKYSPYNNMFK